eukprot:jgi/Picre1/34489/NNA_001957.t1
MPGSRSLGIVPFWGSSVSGSLGIETVMKNAFDNGTLSFSFNDQTLQNCGRGQFNGAKLRIESKQLGSSDGSRNLKRKASMSFDFGKMLIDDVSVEVEHVLGSGKVQEKNAAEQADEPTPAKDHGVLKMKASWLGKSSSIKLNEAFVIDRQNTLVASYNFGTEEAVFGYKYAYSDNWHMSLSYNVQSDSADYTVTRIFGADSGHAKGTLSGVYSPKKEEATISYSQDPYQVKLKLKQSQLASRQVAIPDDVTVEVKGRRVRVKGPRGTLSKDMRHAGLDMFLTTNEEGAKIFKVDCHMGKKKNLLPSEPQSRTIRPFSLNINIVENGAKVEIRNFLGEKRVRVIKMLPGVTIARSDAVKDELILTGNDVELVSRSTSLIHQICLVRNKDIRKFLDGIYLSGKGTVVKDE